MPILYLDPPSSIWFIYSSMSRFTAMTAHILGMVAASLRIRSQAKANGLYYQYIVSGTCGVDVLGPWFGLRVKHTVDS
jgi:hypothetical protein